MTDDNKTTPTHAPGLDLDAVDQDFRAAMEGPPGNRSAIKFYHETWPALIAEVRARAAAEEREAEEREADMHMRIRAGYDKTVADAWRAEVAKRDAEIADLRALVESQRRDYLDVRLTAELAAARAEVDCGQDGPCAKAPGCARHWQERNRELVAELAAARAVTAGVCRYLDCAESDLLAVVTSLYESRARAISDATAARGTVGGLLATAPVGSIVEYMDADGSAWHQVEFNATMTAHRLRIASWGSWKQRDMPQRELRQPARLVPADQADLDPATRGPLPNGG